MEPLPESTKKEEESVTGKNDLYIGMRKDPGTGRIILILYGFPGNSHRY